MRMMVSTGVSSSSQMYMTRISALVAPKGVSIPVAVSVFPQEIYAAPKSWVEEAFPKLIHFNTLPKGGHFAAWEQPDFFVQEMRDSFKSLR